MKKNEGMSLLEIVLAITLFAILIPSIFGIFFANADLASKLSAHTHAKETAADIRSFVKLSTYENIYNLTQNNELLTVEEIDEDGIFMRNFISGGTPKANDLIARFEFVDLSGRIPENSDVAETCALPLKCEIYRVKSREKPTTIHSLQQTCGLEYVTFIVKNR
ncbi:MAG: type II secretion system GspH family protein [Puniceicoccales bacterium]|jgi:type II secretory pathway pseudopilin PulG|nr:type II secretion system GspH family protein [Puniceicoccales bacterium]